ncbi:NAD(P)/FAD-dependent oxidoreductase [Neorhizobium petrolearium]|uniref:FAD-binding oxidoreductase n=1 Tax=Neorhizobium petrolearium TaxID=515361 RepID=A0ABY8MBU1_9HYPH|nr:FAD-binding oxidoreductase [Neorhizobium petrolearium]MCC2613621.1 FAD-binding oxidoreductase [Neorhizobium petrolearium]WGI71937.1 FAD-binding oxidoreductase [Neorhizobium petrolearium]
MNNPSVDVVVIGSGIIGAMAAHYLQQDGHSVMMIERGEVSRGASSGNAGILAFPEIIPIAAPGTIWKAPKWLLDPLGPLSLPPSYALAMVPWLWRFWRAGARAAFNRTVEVNAKMMPLARSEMLRVIGRTGLEKMVSRTGTLDLYDSEESLFAASTDWEAKRNAGFEFNRVGRSEIETLQPGLAPQFRHGIFTPDGLQVCDPYDFTKALVDHAISCGASLRIGEVTRIEPTASGARVALSDGAAFEAKTVVLAGGAWSKSVAASLGDYAPLETERGYNTTLPPGAFPLQRQLYFNDHGFVVTPLSSGIRVGGAVELGGLNLPPNYKRSEAMLKKAKAFLPALKTEGGRQWMGFRPSMPDCLPVISPSSATSAVIYAFGHGHLGLTQSAATGRLVADLAARRQPALPIEPFRIGRFR